MVSQHPEAPRTRFTPSPEEHLARIASLIEAGRLEDHLAAVGHCRRNLQDECRPLLEQLSQASPFPEVRTRAAVKLSVWRGSPNAACDRIEPTGAFLPGNSGHRSPSSLQQDTTLQYVLLLRSSNSKSVNKALSRLPVRLAEAEPLLIEMVFNDTCADARRRAVRLLSRSVSPYIYDVLETIVLMDLDLAVRSAALVALCQKTNRSQTGETLARVLTREVDPQIRERARNFATDNVKWQRALDVAWARIMQPYSPPTSLPIASIDTSESAENARVSAAAAFMTIMGVATNAVDTLLYCDPTTLSSEDALIREAWTAASLQHRWEWKNIAILRQLRTTAAHSPDSPLLQFTLDALDV